jgi:hypothetical protein
MADHIDLDADPMFEQPISVKQYGISSLIKSSDSFEYLRRLWPILQFDHF